MKINTSLREIRFWRVQAIVLALLFMEMGPAFSGKPEVIAGPVFSGKGTFPGEGNVVALSLYVSPSGNDRNPGTLVRPFRTVEGALHVIAGLPGKGPVSIWLRQGVYRPDTTLLITPSVLGDHSLRIASYGSEKATISGTRKLSPVWKPWQRGILQAFIGKGLAPDQLLCNGRVLPMARYPNFDSTQRVFNGTAADAISPERVKRWAHPEGGYVHALHQGEWGGFHYRIEGVDAKGELILEGGWQNNRPAPMHPRYRFVENIFEELDAPGEWFYEAATGVLYVYPGPGLDPARAQWEYTVLDQLVVVRGEGEEAGNPQTGDGKGSAGGVSAAVGGQGVAGQSAGARGVAGDGRSARGTGERKPVREVLIEGLFFTGTNRTFMKTREPLLRTDWTIYRGGAILVENAEKVRIRRCVFEELGGNGIFLSGYNREIGIEGNRIERIGASAVAVVGSSRAVRSPSFQYNSFVPIDSMDKQAGPRSDDYPAHCRIYDNLIHHIGLVEKQVAGVEIDMASAITVSHNTIYHVPRSGINIGDGCWGGHMIEYNDVFYTVLETGDHGAFNSWGRDRYWLPDGHAVDSLTGIYPGMPFWDVIDPITLRNNRWQCAHGWDIDLDDGSSNYRIYNNLCLNGGLKLREGFGRVVENNIMVNNSFHPHVWFRKSGDIFRYNIVFADYAPIGIEVWGKEVDSNFFLQASSLEAARKNGTDVHSVSGNPLFLGASSGNYSVAAGSPARGIGFRNFAMDSFGVVSPALKKLAGRPPSPDARILRGTAKGESLEWMGATIKNIEGLGERSAAGLFDENGILLVKVPEGSKAAAMGLQKGDVIRAVDGKPVNTMVSLLAELQAVNWHGAAALTIIRRQQEQKLNILLK